jgi:HD domain-containing protein
VRERVRQTVRFVAARDGDARHAERTASLLRALGADEELILAGLLHDRGKPVDTRLWHRVAGVLLGGLGPRVRRRLARGDSTFARYLDHARRGAAQAEL